MAGAPTPSAQPAATQPGAGQAPNYLAPLTMKQIVNQARSTISKAYGPAYQDLAQQQNQAEGLNAKRAADNRYYQSWLDSQMKGLQAHAAASQGQLINTEQQLRAEQNGLYAQQPGQLVTGADARAGNVSDNSQSNAFGQELSQNQQANMGLLTGAEQQATGNARAETSQLVGARANNFGLIHNDEVARIADLNKALTTIANARSKLTTSRTADIAKEVARLQGVEIQKAQSNRDYGAVVAKLGLQQANINSEINTRSQNANTAAGRLQLDLTKAQLAQMNSDRNYQLNKDKYSQTVAKDLYERQHGLGPYKPAKSGTAAKPALSTASQNSIYGHLSRVRAGIQFVEGFYLNDGYSEQQAQNMAYHAIANGFYVGPGGQSHKSPLREGDAGILNAAYNTLSDRGGLTPGDVSFLENLGLTNPGARLPVIPNYTPSPGAAASRT